MKLDFFYKFFLILFFILPFSFILGPGPWNINFFLITLSSLVIICTNINNFNHLDKNMKIFYSFLFLFCIYLIINSILSPYTDKIISRSISYLRFFFIILAIPFVLNIKEDFLIKFTWFFLSILILSILAVCISSFAEFLRLDLPIYTKSNVDYRLNGPFGDEAIVGTYLYFFFPGLLFLFKTLKIKNFFLIPLTGFVLFLIFASGERMVILMTLGFIISYLILRTNEIKKIISFFSVIFLMTSCLIVFTTNESFNPNIFEENDISKSYGFRVNQTLKEFKDPFNTSYFIHYKTAYSIFENNKIFGSGFKTFRYECSDKKYDTIGYSSEMRCRTHPHNVHLELLSDTGIIGYLLFSFTILSFLIYYFKSAYSKYTLYLFIPFLLFLFPIRVSGSLFGSVYGGLFWYQFFFLLLYSNINLKKFI